MFNLSLEEKSTSTVARDQIFDVIIIGAGPAGLTTAIYTARDGWTTLVLEKKAPGGLAASTHSIENYPGFPDGVPGVELMERFERQADKFGAVIAPFQEVAEIHQGVDTLLTVRDQHGYQYRGRTILITTGSKPRHLGIPGEEEFYNKGVSYCTTCDGPLYMGQEVIVIGCGNSGLQEAEILLQYARRVTFVEYLDHSIAERVLQSRVQNHPKAVCLLSHQAEAVSGNEHVESLMVTDRRKGEKREISTAAVFIYIGYIPHTDFVKGYLNLDESGYIITDDHLNTNIPGIFAAGDLRSKNLAQVSVAVGDGTEAAVSIREYSQEHVQVEV